MSVIQFNKTDAGFTITTDGEELEFSNAVVTASSASEDTAFALNINGIVYNFKLSNTIEINGVEASGTAEEIVNQLYAEVFDGGEVRFLLDISFDDFHISVPGIYIIKKGTDPTDGGNIHFEDMSAYEGKWVTIISADNEDQHDAEFQGSNKPYVNGTSTTWNRVMYGEMHRYVVIEGVLRGGKLSE